MPSRSAKQARTMRAAAHDNAFAKKVGIPQDVAAEYVEADKKRRVASWQGGKSKARQTRTSIGGRPS